MDITLKYEKRKKILVMIVSLALVLIIFSVPVFASESAGNELIRNSFKNLLDIVIAIVSSIGAILILWGIFDFATALQSQDGALQSASFKRIGGGLVAVLGPQLLNVFLG